MDIEARNHAVATAAGSQCAPEVRWRKHSLPGPSPSPISAGSSLHADGRPAKRTYPEAFPHEGEYVSQSPYERRHTFPLPTAGDPRYTQTDPPVPIHSSGAAQPVSYSQSLPYDSQLSTGFGTAPELAGYNIPHLSSFPGQHISPIAPQSYEPSSLSHHHHHPAVPSSSHGTSSAFLPPESYNSSTTTPSSHTRSQQHQQQQSPSASSTAAGIQRHHNAPVGVCNVGSHNGGNMTRHDVPSESILRGHPHTFPGNSFHNSQTRTSSTTIMHHEEQTRYHVPQQYYNPYGGETSQLPMHQVPDDTSPPAVVDAMGVEREWDMVPDAPGAGELVSPAEERGGSPMSGNRDIVIGGGNADKDDRRLGGSKRSKFDQDKLVETNMTRRLKACVRCRIQRVRCERDPNDRDGTCMTCKGVSPNSKKVIHKIPCLRYKLTETVLYREGGLHLTKRWETTSLQLHNVGDWASSEIRTIELTLGICDEPFQLKVRKFAPKEGDVVHRHWVDGTIKKKKELQPYALADVAAAAKDFMSYVRMHCVDGLLKSIGHKQPIVKKTYEMAVKHYRDLVMMQDNDIERRENPEAKFLYDLFWVVFAMRHTRGSSWICGSDKLDMEPETKDQSYPLFNRVSTPRMIVAQFDSINALKVLQPVRSRLLAKLEEWVSSSKPTYWFTIYLSYFILLHEVSLTCEDRYRHAVANSAGTRYTIPNFVTELQRGANVMLAHWQYYKADVDPLNLDIRTREKSQLNFLTAEQLMFVVQSYREANALQDDFQQVWEADFWEHPYFYVSQMFEPSWSPRRIWTINYPGPAPPMM